MNLHELTMTLITVFRMWTVLMMGDVMSVFLVLPQYFIHSNGWKLVF